MKLIRPHTTTYEMSNLKHKIPQAGSANCRESRPASNAGCPTDSGGGKDSINLTQNRNELPKLQESNSNSSSRKSSIASIDLTWDEEQTRSVLKVQESKRKRESLDTGSFVTRDAKKKISNESIYKKKTCLEVHDIKEALERFAHLTSKLKKNIEQNTKKEIKELAGLFAKQVANVNRDNINKWLNEHAHITDKAMYDVDTQTEEGSTMEESTRHSTDDEVSKMREKIRYLEKTNKTLAARVLDLEMRSYGPNTGYANKDKILQISTYEDWLEAAGMKWREDVYSTTSIDFGNMNKDPNEVMTKIVIINPEDPKLVKSIQSETAKRHPEILTGTGATNMYEQITSTRNGGGEVVISRIKLIVIRPTQLNEASLWDNLTQTKDMINEGEYVVTHGLPGVDTGRMRKMLETIYMGTSCNIKLYADANERSSATRTRNTYAIVVDSKDQDFKKVLGEVKKALGTNPAAMAIKNIRSTKDGNVLITTNKDGEKFRQIAETIRKNNSKLNTRLLKGDNNVTLYLRGMEDDTSVDEIKTALTKISDGGDFKVSDTRPLARNTLAVTVVTDPTTAERMLNNKKGRLRVGYSLCYIEKRIEVTQCKRCWGFGHTKANCSGKDREDLCFRCGGADHKRGKCKNDEFCPICEVSGHRAGRGGCAALREELKVKRKVTRRQRFNTYISDTSEILDIGDDNVFPELKVDKLTSTISDRQETTPSPTVSEEISGIEQIDIHKEVNERCAQPP